MQHRQEQSIVKNEFVETYGFKEVSSGFVARTLNVQQFPSIFSTLNTVEHVSLVVPAGQAVASLATGIDQGCPFAQHV